ncbi:PP2C family protein-serine/threonine phosphatase [Jatrophihabitans sp. YIM 134969]
MLSELPLDVPGPAAPVTVARVDTAPSGPPDTGLDPVDLRALQLLVVEDDEGDAFLLAAALQDAGIPEDSVRWFRTLAEGRRAVVERPADCVLVDLGLPDASGLESVRGMTSTIDTAVIVLTGLAGQSGQPALAAGAQDYLVKDGLHAEVLSRAIRYAVERKRVERAAFALEQARLRSTENARLERGLLPRPVLDGRRIASATTYRAGRDHTLLGGDFYDIVQRADGSVRAIIGDVMGHGPDEAALGVHLRVAWRALVLAGLPDPTVLATLDTVLTSERAVGNPFVTVCDITVAPDRRSMTVRSAGHPAPVVVSDGGVAWQPDLHVMPPLGIARAVVPAVDTVVPLGAAWQVMLYTDGLLDSFRDHVDVTDIGFSGLLAAATAAAHRDPQVWLSGVVARAPRVVTDDMAVVALATTADPS